MGLARQKLEFQNQVMPRCSFVPNWIKLSTVNFLDVTYIRKNKPGTAKVGAISKAQNLEGGPFGLCETPAGCKKFFKKWRGDPLETWKNFRKFFNEIFEQCHSAQKCKRAWHPLCCKTSKKIEGGTLWGKNFNPKSFKKSHSSEKKLGILSVISRLWTSVLFFLFVLDASEVGVVEVWSWGGCWTNEQKVDLSCLKNKKNYPL